MRNFLFSELRGKLNLGYVAGSYHKDIYLQNGIIVRLNGEKNFATDNEQFVEDALK